MKVKELVDLLREVKDTDSEVVLGKIVEVGGGIAAHVDTDNLFVTKVSNFVVFHTNNLKKPHDHGNKLGTVTDFD